MRLRPIVALILLAACSRKIEGPTPSVTGAQNERDQSTGPAYLCNAQGDPTDGWLLDVLGDKFAPLPTNSLTQAHAGVLMPSVKLAGPEAYSVPDAYVRFIDKTRMPLAMRTADSAADPHTLPAGDYTITVTNLNSASGTSPAAALRVIPPPTETQVQVQPTGGSLGNANLCADQSTQTLVITGTGFRTDAKPTVSFLNLAGSPVVTLPSSAVTVVSTTEIDAVVDGALFAGALSSSSGTVYTVSVTDPAGCRAPYGTAERGFGITDVKVFNSCLLLGALSMNPRFGWQQKNQAITISNTFALPATHGFSGGAPTVTITAPLRGSTTPVEIPLRRVAFVNASTITALVPTCSGMSSTPFSDTSVGGCPNGIAPGGPYEVHITDPSGATGSLTGAQGFVVVQDEPPVIASIGPSAIDTGGIAHLVIASGGLTGTNFAASAKPQIVFPAGANLRACDLPVNSQTTSSIDAKVQNVAAGSCVEYDPTGAKVAAAGGFTIATGLFVIRVQDTADPAYGDFSGLIVTNPSANPTNAAAVKSSLSGPRADFPLVQAGDDIGNQYLYAIGGISGPVGKPSSTLLSTIETAQITDFGDVGGDCSGASCVFRVLDRTQLGFTGPTSTTPAPRRGAAAVSIQVPGDTGYVFVLGGIDGSGHAVTTVERAQVLKAADAPVINSPITLAATGGNLAAGTYYYKVSALLASGNAANPGGETLASDIEPVSAGTGTAKATLSWPCLAGADKYRIYRTINANDPAGTERLLAEVTKQATCTGSPLPNESFIDDGGTVPSGLKPLPAGALGRWVAMPSLSTARGQASAKVVKDRVYVVGGCSATGGSPACDGTGAVETGTYEDSTITVNAVDGFASSGALNQARRQAGLTIASKVTAPDRFVTTHTDDVWLVLAGGMQGGSPLTNGAGGANGGVEVAQVVVGGGATAATPGFGNASYGAAGFGVQGGWAEVVADILFMFGNTGTSTGFSFKSNDVCNGAACTATSSFTGTLNDTGASVTNRYLPGETLFRAYFYAAGGLTNTSTGAGSTATALSTVERILY